MTDRKALNLRKSFVLKGFSSSFPNVEKGAVRVGFEPTEPSRVHFFSKEALSTTQPPNLSRNKSVAPAKQKRGRKLPAKRL